MNATATPALEETIAVFRRWLYLPDPSAVLVSAATIAANRISGDPVWLLLVGAPGGGKSEVINSFASLPHMHPASVLTEASLLSGTPKRDQAEHSKGGLLRVIGDFGILLLKDFTSVLSMHRDERARVLSALREIYDGSWTRHLGTEGGKTLSWDGRVGLLGGVTPTIDRHHAVMGAMGERFVFFRLPEVDESEQARRSIAHAGRETTMRAELGEATAALLDRDFPQPRPRTEEEITQLVALTRLVVRARSAVERDSYTRELELIGEPEAPTRLIVVLSRLLDGLEAIGCSESASWQIVTKCALDSTPQLRRSILETLEPEEMLETGVIAETLGYPTQTARRGLEDLTAHGLLERYRAQEGKSRSDSWSLSEWTRARLAEMASNRSRFVSLSGCGDEIRLFTSSDTSGTIDVAAGNGHIEAPDLEFGQGYEFDGDIPF